MSNEEKKVIAYLRNYCNTDLLYEQKHYDYIKYLIKSFEKQQNKINEARHKGFIDGRISMRYELQDKIEDLIIRLKQADSENEYIDFTIKILCEFLSNLNIKEENS